MEFCGLDHEALSRWCQEQGWGSYVADQLFDWVYQKKVFDFALMSNVKKEYRSALAATFSLPRISLERSLTTEEATKCLWRLPDGYFVESVLLFSPGRKTLSVSSQVGCPARCAFCASGKQGGVRNLSRGEILEQVLLTEELLHLKGERLSHIVFMGMGEPLENFSALQFALKQLQSPKVFVISQRKITVSTVGIVDQIYALADSGSRVPLVLSLHAPSQEIRKKIIPYARKYDLDEILAAMDYYAKTTKRDITYEYILIEGLNAAPEHAAMLAKLLQEKRLTQSTVNLIPYNPVPGLRLKRPSQKAILAFERTLQKLGIRFTRRYTKGTEIAAACGQLALHPASGASEKSSVTPLRVSAAGCA